MDEQTDFAYYRTVANTQTDGMILSSELSDLIKEAEAEVQGLRAEVERLKKILRETGILSPSLLRRKYGYDVGQWVTTAKYGRVFKVLGWGETEDEALKRAEVTLEEEES